MDLACSHPYHHQKVQVMQPQDFASRAHFCRWFLHRCVKEPNFPWGSFSLTKRSSPGKLFPIHATVMCRLMKTRIVRSPWISGTIQSEHLGMFLDGCVIGQTFLHQISRVPRTCDSLKAYCMGFWKMCHCMSVKTCAFSTMAHHLIFNLRSEII